MDPLRQLPPKDADSGRVHVLIDTPAGSQGKFKFDPDLKVYRLGRMLPRGAVFPHDFGSIPGTRAPDGDPLDVLVLQCPPTFCGCLVSVRLIGVLKAPPDREGPHAAERPPDRRGGDRGEPGAPQEPRRRR